MVLLHAIYCASQLPSTFSLSPSLQQSMPYTPLPLHQLLTISQIPTAVQSYTIAMETNEANQKDNMAASLRYELAVQLERKGDMGSSIIYLEECAEELLLQDINVPSRSNSKMVSKKINRKASSRAPLTALSALQRALANSIHISGFFPITLCTTHLLIYSSHSGF